MIGLFKKLAKMLRAEGYEGIQTPKDRDALFELRYDELPVGKLELHNGKWVFTYAPEFKGQSRVSPLIDFPQLDKIYSAESLWPFFMARIPSLTQAHVREAVEKEGLDEHSDVDLLRRFGQRTISNPFVLQDAL